MDKQTVSQNRPDFFYSEMLLRQHPWLKNQLEEEEYPIAVSYRKPEKLFGFSLLLIGCVIMLDPVFHVNSFGGIFPVLLLVLLGAAIIYIGAWSLFFSKRSYVLVTSERLIWQKINLLGQPGKRISIPRTEIQRARFLKSTVMFRINRSDGDISISTNDGKTIVIPSVLEAENILGALR